MTTLDTTSDSLPLKVSPPAGQPDHREGSKVPDENPERGADSPQGRAAPQGLRLPYLDIMYKTEQEQKGDESGKAPQWQTRTKEERKKGRLCFTLKTGLNLHCQDTVRFLTLTSSTHNSGNIMRAFGNMVQDIRRTTPGMLDTKNMLSSKDRYIYSSYNKDVDEPLKIEYCGCRTSEGNGVIHVLTVGDYIPFRYFKDRWQHHHNSSSIYIRAVKREKADKTAGYLLTQYMRGQTAYIRGFHSKGWLYPGCREDFKTLLKRRKEEGHREHVRTRKRHEKERDEWETVRKAHSVPLIEREDLKEISDEDKAAVDKRVYQEVLIEWGKTTLDLQCTRDRLYNEDRDKYLKKCRTSHRKRLKVHQRCVPDPSAPEEPERMKQYGKGLPIPRSSPPLPL